MAYTNFPYGVTSFGVPVITGPLPVIPINNVFYVQYTQGTDAVGRGKSPSEPFKTLDFAVGQCEASKGDIIFLMAGHTDTAIAAGTITIDVAGITIIGLGTGTLRPTISFTTAATATVAISAANVTISNVIFNYVGVDAIATGINVTGANCHINKCKFVMADGTNQAVQAITGGTGATSLKVTECEFLAPNAGATAAIYSAVALDDVQIGGCYFYGDFSTAAITNVTNAWTLCRIWENQYYGTNATEPIFDVVSTATGLAWRNYIAVATLSNGLSTVGDGIFKFENYATEVGTSAGILDPAAAALT